ncbi:unnamed protein product [Lymnaea stagnalis]|uniref:CAP-Gly domain-containing protein n=1 Tax=Lymnaea stagnalis TaxID=6523 RepID=A0AAV2IM32_LYMST
MEAMEQIKASQEGKKRRSFLPSFKKPSPLSPTSPQPPTNTSLPTLLQTASTVTLLTSSPIVHLPTVTPAPTTAPTAAPSFGYSVREPSATSRPQPASLPGRRIQAPTVPNKEDIENVAYGVGLRVGARVKISGVKPGILRYLGTTHLAPGIFCGIELFDPDGNHDGEVNGHRYFSCAPNHGIFAPKEKVCLETSSSLGRVASDSTDCYSSTESLSERTHKAFKTFEEGELEAIDCSKLSPIISPQDVDTVDDATLTRHHRSSKLHSTSQFTSPYRVLDPGLSTDSLESQDSLDIPQKKARSSLPRAKSSLPTVSSVPVSKLPTFSRPSSKYSEPPPLLYQRKLPFPSQPGDSLLPDVGLRSQHSPVLTDSDQERDKYRTGSARSSEDSEEDGFLRDTLSRGIKKQLRADSRQYLNFTFDPEEEVSHSADQEDSEDGDNATYTSGHVSAVNPLYRDPLFVRDLSGDSSDDGVGAHDYSNRYLEKTLSVAQGERIYFREGGDRSQRSTGQKTLDATKSSSYTVERSDRQRALDMSLSGSESNEDATRLSVTHSISDSDLPPEVLPQVDDGRGGSGLSTGYDCCDEDRLSEGGYGIASSGDGNSGGLNLTRPLDSRKSDSYTIAQGAVVQSQSYTICTQESDNKRDHSKVERGPVVLASHSYSISKSDSATSSPSKKYRKISTGSSVNEGGDSSSSGTEPKTDSSGEVKGETLDDSSTGASPEVSQALEWDYGQEFDGRIPPSQHDSTMTTSASTGTSESLSDVLRDISEHSDGAIEPEMPSSVIDDSELFETPDNEFENIDSLEDFPIFGKDCKTIMTDSGISDKSFEFCPNKSSSSTVCGNSSDECSREDDASSHTTTRAISSDSSQETLAAECAADTPGSIEDKDFLPDDLCASHQSVECLDDLTRVDPFCDGNSNSPGSVISMEDMSVLQDKTLIGDDAGGEMDLEDDDLLAGPHGGDVTMDMDTCSHRVDGLEFDQAGRYVNRKERPVSILSTTSADTGYVPDTDSEFGTLTTNSPNMDWVDRHGVAHPTSYAPGEERSSDEMDFEINEKMTSYSPVEKTPTSGHSSDLGVRRGEDDDYTIGNTEDDRIEADQVYGLRACGPKSDVDEIHQTMDVDVQSGSGREDSGNEVSGESGDNSSHREFELLPSPTSASSPKDNDESKDVTEGKKDNSAQQRRPQAKKITITKKRSENIDHKMPNINVTSKLADYIRTAPPPARPREDKEPKKILSKNARNIQKRLSVDGNKTPKLDTSRSSSAEREKERDESMDREKFDKPEKVKPLIKRAPPKSKWGNIMSQIEASKDTVKPKPKSEIKSSLAAYLSTPAPQLASENNALTVNMVKVDQQPTVKRREFVKRIKPLPPPPPKIDLSKIKSKLNVPTAASAVKAVPKRDASPSNRRNKTTVRASRDSSPADHSVTSELKESLRKRLSADGHIVLLRQGMSTTVSSVRSSHTDLSMCASMDSVGESRGDEGTPSKRGSVDLTAKADRRYSTSSFKSDHSEKTKCNGDQTKGSQDHRSRRSKVNSTIPSHTPNVLPTRALEIRLGDASVVSSQRSSPTPVIVKPIKPKPKNIPNAKGGAAKPVWGATKPSPPPAKGRDSSANQGRKSRVNSSAKISGNVQAAPSSTTTAASATTQKEIVRLVSLCEARTKELTHAKIQLKATTQGFDAMAVLVNYCCAELNAFECPILAEKLVTVQRQLTDCLAQISELTTQKDELDKNLTQVIHEKDQVCKQIEETLQSAQTEREEHAKMTKDLDDTHNAALTTQRDELTTKHEEALKKFLQYYDKQTEFLKQSQERQLSEVKNEGKLEMNGIRISHLEEIQELRNKHDSQMEELHKQHRNKLEDITHRFETIKLSLSEKVESLRGECEDLRHRARNSEEALQRDADVKVQMALAPFMSLPAEIESLKTVVEMRNEEIQKLRTKNMDLEKQLEEVPIGREKIISLQQKVENLEAIINIKTDHEKQMHEHCQVLMRKYDRASRANKRLSMDYEQVMWRMSQSSEFGSSESLTQRQMSRSPARSERGSPDGRHRALSPNSASEVVMRKKRNSHSVGEGDRKLRSRSATFVLEKHESSDSHSPSSSPQPKLKRWRKKSEAEEKSSGKTRAERMCHSAGAELISDLIGQEAWVDKGEKATLPDAPDSLTSSVDNADSYTRSVSGVSDSGVYDSMSRSDMLNSSVVSTDSEWATSVNLSMNLDSNMDDLDSGPKSGDYVSLNDVTVITKPGGNKSSMKSSNTVVFCLDKNLDPVLETSKVISDAPTAEFTRPDMADDVFDGSISMESSCCSFDNFDITSASDSRLTSASEDFSANETVVDNVSDATLACNVSLEKSPQISSTPQSK